MSTQKLYHYFLTVKLQPNAETGEPEAVVESRFPSGDLPKAENSLMGMITQFCFPDKEKFPKHNLSPKSKKFTFVVTNIEGTKRFGYCKRSLTGQISISNQGKRWPVCHCILSVFPCHSIFDQILEATSRLDPAAVTDLMTQLQNHSLPAPGDGIYATISVGDPTAPRLEAFRFSRPEQETSLSGFADFKALLTSIDPFTIATILMALLMERRVIFISRKLSILSSCVQACVALLYPFTWQHVFIPVLPLGMIQFVCAPVPFVVGLLASHLGDLQAQAELMDEVLLIDVESSSPVPPSTDFKLVPEKFLLPLVATIAKARKVVLEEKKKAKSEKSVGDKLKNFFNNPGDRQSMAPGSRTTVALAELYKDQAPQDNVAKIMENAFISFFAETMGHYTQFLTASSFDKKAFMEHDPQLTPFLLGVGGSQLFEQFIAQRQNSSRIKSKTSLGSLPSPRGLTSAKADLTTDAKLADVVVREGYLSKWGKGMKGTAWARLKEGKDHRGTIHEGSMGTFQLRFWRLSYFNLTYHKSEDSKPSGTIPLNEIEAVNLVEWRGMKDCLEIVTADRSYQLHTENNADMNWWLEVLQWKLALLREFSGKSSSPSLGKVSTASSISSSTMSTASSGGSGLSPPNASGGQLASSSAPGSFSSSTFPGGSSAPSTSDAPASVPLRTHSMNGGSNAASNEIIQPRTSNRPPSKTLVTSYMKDRVNAWGQAGPKQSAAPPSGAVRMGAKGDASISSSSSSSSSSSASSATASFTPGQAPPPPPKPSNTGETQRGRSSAMHGGSGSDSSSATSPRGPPPPLHAAPVHPVPPSAASSHHHLVASVPPNRYGSTPLSHHPAAVSAKNGTTVPSAAPAAPGGVGEAKKPRPLMRSHDGFAASTSSAPSTPTGPPAYFGVATPTAKTTTTTGTSTPSPPPSGPQMGASKSFRRLPTPPAAATTDHVPATSSAPSYPSYGAKTTGSAQPQLHGSSNTVDSACHDAVASSSAKNASTISSASLSNGSASSSDLSSSAGATTFKRHGPVPVPPTLVHTVSAPLQYNNATRTVASKSTAASQPPAQATSRPLPRPPQ